MKEIRAHQLAEWLENPSLPKPTLLDVREAWECELCRIDGSQHIPMHLVPMRCADELDASRDIVVICHHGGRSMQVAMFLEHKGYESVFNLTGGIEAWACEVEPGMRRY